MGPGPDPWPVFPGPGPDPWPVFPGPGPDPWPWAGTGPLAGIPYPCMPYTRLRGADPRGGKLGSDHVGPNPIIWDQNPTTLGY